MQIKSLAMFYSVFSEDYSKKKKNSSWSIGKYMDFVKTILLNSEELVLRLFSWGKYNFMDA